MFKNSIDVHTFFIYNVVQLLISFLFRVEFIDVSLAAPVAGECGNDTLTITGDPVNTPTLCGTLTDDPTSRCF